MHPVQIPLSISPPHLLHGEQPHSWHIIHLLLSYLPWGNDCYSILSRNSGKSKKRGNSGFTVSLTRWTPWEKLKGLSAIFILLKIQSIDKPCSVIYRNRSPCGLHGHDHDHVPVGRAWNDSRNCIRRWPWRNDTYKLRQ